VSLLCNVSVLIVSPEKMMHLLLFVSAFIIF